MYSEIKKLKSEVSRRALMQGIAGLSLGVSSVAPSFLSAATSMGTSSGDRKKVVRIFLPGAMTHIDSFDPKPQTPSVMGDTKVIKTNTGEEISAYYPELAKRMDKLALVRSMTSTEADHERAQYLNATSYAVLGTTKHPDFGAWMLKMKGSQNEALPASVSIQGGGTGGYLGTDYDPFDITNTREPLKGLVMNDPTSEESLALLKLMANVRRDFHKKYRVEQVDSYASFYNDSIKFMQSKDLEAFDLTKEDKASKEKYNIKHGEKLLLARRLLQANVQYISVGVNDGWDTHFNLWDETNYPTKAKALDIALATFIDDLYEHGLNKNTIFTVNTDFGRSPEITEGGRNHHRRAFSAIIGGAGVKNGIIYGKTDDKAFSVVENPVFPHDFNATLAKLVGIDLNKEIYSPDNRPFTVARGGNAVPGLIA